MEDFERKFNFTCRSASTGYNNDPTNPTIFKDFKMQRCKTRKDLIENGVYDDLKKRFISKEESYWCINGEFDESIANTWGDPKFKIFVMQLYWCNNSTENGNSCLPREELKKSLTSLEKGDQNKE